MSLQQWLENAWVQEIERSPVTVHNLMDLAARHIADGSLEGLSSDGRFIHAYDAVRTLCEVALHAAGYRVAKGGRHHELDIESLKLTLGEAWSEEADFFDYCRRARHKSVYDYSHISPQEADQLLDAAKRLMGAVRAWIEKEHADLL